MVRFLALVTLLLLDAAVTAPMAAAQSLTGGDLLLLVGARVRVLAPRLGEGWHIGMFNRLRVEPPCYRILLFDPAASGRIAATLSARDLTRIQVSILGDGRTRSYTLEPNEDLNSKEGWRDVSLEALGEAERSCRVADGPLSDRGNNGASQPNRRFERDALGSALRAYARAPQPER